jgi:hypothetical protein
MYRDVLSAGWSVRCAFPLNNLDLASTPGQRLAELFFTGPKLHE